MSTFFTADLHKGHQGILKFCASTRPFRNIGEHDDFIRKSWREVVRDGDDVIVGGDFAFGGAEPKELRKFFLSLPGRKTLVVGNHDKNDATLSLPWEGVHDILNVSADSQRAVVCHYAFRSWEGIRKGALNFWGHHHGRLPGHSQGCDIGVDVHGFVPQRMNQLKAYIKTMPPLVDPEGTDFGADPEGGLSL
jgi:calcineurin-like phosphoesterase family protein